MIVDDWRRRGVIHVNKFVHCAKTQKVIIMMLRSNLNHVHAFTINVYSYSYVFIFLSDDSSNY